MRLRVPRILPPPSSLEAFCESFKVQRRHKISFENGVRIWLNGSSARRKPHTRPTAILDEYVKSLLEAKVIEPSQRGPFVASLFAIPKTNGEARLIVDYSNITPLLSPPKYYLPSIYQIVSRKHFPFRDPFFVKIDLRNALKFTIFRKNIKFFIKFKRDRLVSKQEV